MRLRRFRRTEPAIDLEENGPLLGENQLNVYMPEVHAFGNERPPYICNILLDGRVPDDLAKRGGTVGREGTAEDDGVDLPGVAIHVAAAGVFLSDQSFLHQETGWSDRIFIDETLRLGLVFQAEDASRGRTVIGLGDDRAHVSFRREVVRQRACERHAYAIARQGGRRLDLVHADVRNGRGNCGGFQRLVAELRNFSEFMLRAGEHYIDVVFSDVTLEMFQVAGIGRQGKDRRLHDRGGGQRKEAPSSDFLAIGEMNLQRLIEIVHGERLVDALPHHGAGPRNQDIHEYLPSARNNLLEVRTERVAECKPAQRITFRQDAFHGPDVQRGIVLRQDNLLNGQVCSAGNLV